MYKNFIKKYYLMGLYTDIQLNIFVLSKNITEEEREEIIDSKRVII
ncbi:XkdX family protein [Clostridium botulinum]|nr:XkdX family protein [Clostridium botulinum]